MANRQHLSSHQRKIVKRYYEHLDTIAITKLQELVSELYLCTNEKKSAQLWQRAETALAKLRASDSRVAKILEARNVEGLALLVGELS